MALSCLEISASIWAMRAWIMAWVSSETVICPAITWSTNSAIMSLATARCSASRSHAAFGDDLVEEASFLGLCRGSGGLVFLLGGTHAGHSSLLACARWRLRAEAS